MNKENFKLNFIPIIISTLIITILHNFSLINYNKYFILPIILLLITYIYLLNKNKMIINNKAYQLLTPIILIILGTVIFHTDVSNKVLNIIIIPILISIFFLSLTNKFYQISASFIKWFIKLFPSNLLTNLNIIKENTNITSEKKKKISNILLGILISIPLVIAILNLLTSADMYFNVFINKITNNLDKFFFNFKFLRNNILIFIIYFIILFSTFVNIIKNKNTKIASSKIRKIDSSIISPILIMINFVFVLFVVSEISKLTINFLQLPETYTYATYAREGFFQLLGVTVINFTIILLLLYKTDAIEKNKLLKSLILLLITFTIILIFNSYYRMFLYIGRFGFTILRMQVILFLLMELILLMIIIKKILSNLKHKDAILFFITIITTYIINIYICNKEVIELINRIINK